MIHLSLPELLHVAERTVGEEPPLRDVGLLESALARPRATAFGSEAYPSLEEKAAAGEMTEISAIAGRLRDGTEAW